MCFKKLFDSGYKELKKAEPIAKQIDDLKEATEKLTDEELKAKTEEFKSRFKNGETLDDLMVEAYAVAREASVRVTGMTPYFVQLLGAIIIHGGNIAEMRTGEGKTLTAVLPAYLNALNGKGVHIVTVNEYLARREAEGEIGDIFRFLGLTVGLNIRDLTADEKKEAYATDVLYSTNSELGFDYLRDHMVLYEKDIVQKRGLNFAIIDEVDSILIDEARTPLIISGGAKQGQSLYRSADRFAKSLRDEDYFIEIETKTIELSQSGINKAEKIFSLENLYDIRNVNLVHHINNALRAVYIMQRDKDYMVQNNEVLIIDQFTGRVLPGRQYSEGLHQALEAKENVDIKKETITVATITYQNFFRMYSKLSGMTGTAKTEEEEFREIYNMYVAVIPTNEPMIREDAPDYLFATLKEKYEALVADIEYRHNKGQPILIGTVAVETSEYLSHLLKLKRIPHNVLNAKHHASEAEFVETAGQKGAVTIATNMAGRGTDIKLGEGVVELGGLAVLGSERHEARRIDDQLRGRAGRQGDPGFSRFYLSAEDELLVRFGGESFKNRIAMIQNLTVDKNDPDAMPEPLESRMFSRFIKNAQKRIEGQNYDMRKNVLRYDDVIRKQREVIYAQRMSIIVTEDIEPFVLKTAEEYVYMHLRNLEREGKTSPAEIIDLLNGQEFNQGTFTLEELEALEPNELENYIVDKAIKEITSKKDDIPIEVYREFLKIITLRVIDTHWTQHIDEMSELRQSVRLQAYAQKNPLQAYQEEGFVLFTNLTDNISKDITTFAVRGRIRMNAEREQVVKNTRTNEGDDSNRGRKHRPRSRGNKYQRAVGW